MDTHQVVETAYGSDVEGSSTSSNPQVVSRSSQNHISGDRHAVSGRNEDETNAGPYERQDVSELQQSVTQSSAAQWTFKLVLESAVSNLLLMKDQTVQAITSTLRESLSHLTQVARDMGETETKLAANLSFRKFASKVHEGCPSANTLFETIVWQFCTLGQIQHSHVGFLRDMIKVGSSVDELAKKKPRLNEDERARKILKSLEVTVGGVPIKYDSIAPSMPFSRFKEAVEKAYRYHSDEDISNERWVKWALEHFLGDIRETLWQFAKSKPTFQGFMLEASRQCEQLDLLRRKTDNLGRMRPHKGESLSDFYRALTMAENDLIVAGMGEESARAIGLLALLLSASQDPRVAGSISGIVAATKLANNRTREEILRAEENSSDRPKTEPARINEGGNFMYRKAQACRYSAQSCPFLSRGHSAFDHSLTEPSPEEEGAEEEVEVEEVEAVEQARQAGLEEMETRRTGTRVHAGEITILRPRGMGWRTGDRIAKCG